MDNQPKPTETVACGNCKYARIIPNIQNPLEKVLVCHFLPPHPMLMYTSAGPMLGPSTHPPVMADAWCFQFKAADTREEIESKAPPKLLGGDGKSILNG